jgi:hypothetical protein
MRLLRIRMTTRRWMVAVAVVGLVACGYRLKRRRDDFVRKADYHEGAAEALGVLGADDPGEEVRRGIERHAACARKYRHAARYPWLPFEPDPLPE